MDQDLCLKRQVLSREVALSKLGQLGEAFQKRPVRLAYLFGSLARDNMSPLSDIDIAVFMDPDSYDGLGNYSQIYDDACRIFNADNIGLLVLNDAPPRVRFRAVQEGILIYAVDPTARAGFEERVIAEYQDTAPLGEEQWHYLRQRIQEGVTKAVSKIDQVRVRALLLRMEQSLLHLTDLASLDLAAFLAPGNWQPRALVEHELRIAIEAALAIGRHIIAAKRLGTPEEYKDIGRILGDKGIVPPDLAEKMQKMAALRNLLVHLYWEVDYQRLHHIVRTELQDLEQYAQCIVEYISKGDEG